MSAWFVAQIRIHEAELLRWYRSPEYQALAAHRRRAADCNVVSVEGRDR